MKCKEFLFILNSFTKSVVLFYSSWFARWIVVEKKYSIPLLQRNIVGLFSFKEQQCQRMFLKLSRGCHYCFGYTKFSLLVDDSSDIVLDQSPGRSESKQSKIHDRKTLPRSGGGKEKLDSLMLHTNLKVTCAGPRKSSSNPMDSSGHHHRPTTFKDNYGNEHWQVHACRAKCSFMQKQWKLRSKHSYPGRKVGYKCLSPMATMTTTSAAQKGESLPHEDITRFLFMYYLRKSLTHAV